MAMKETPAERERRLAEIREQTAIQRRLKRAERDALKSQDLDVQLLATHRDMLLHIADMLSRGEDDVEGQLPATITARESAVSALRTYAAEIGVEIGIRWAG